MDSVENVQDLLKTCLLPELKQDLDTIPIQKEHFKSYHDCLQLQLPILYDWIQQEPTRWLFAGNAEDAKQQEIQSYLIILLCELSSPHSVFHLDIPELVTNCERVLHKFPKLSQKVEELIFKYYQEKLHKEAWKRQIGAVHSFISYLQFRYNGMQVEGSKMTQQFLMFCLSVGLNIRSCYETHYKYLSTCVFRTILQHGSNEDILSLNIHSVIFDAISKDLHVMDSIPFIEHQWNCVLNCLDFFVDIDSFTWNQLDDSLEILLRYIPLAPNSQTSISLMKFVSKFVVYFNINRQEFENKLLEDQTQTHVINECRLLSKTNTSYTGYRWAKTILQTLILESYRLMQSKDICKAMLMEIHRCYMVTILPINLTVLEKHLETFLEKFTAVLMEVVKAQKFKEDIMQVVTLLLETFCYQLKNCTDSEKLFRFHEAYKNLLISNVFKKYSSTH